MPECVEQGCRGALSLKQECSSSCGVRDQRDVHALAGELAEAEPAHALEDLAERDLPAADEGRVVDAAVRVPRRGDTRQVLGQQVRRGEQVLPRRVQLPLVQPAPPGR